MTGQGSLWPNPAEPEEPVVAPPSPVRRFGTEKQIEAAVVDGRLRIATTGEWVVECQQCGNWEAVEVARRKNGRTGWQCQDGIVCLSMRDAIAAGEYTPRFLGKWAAVDAAP